MKSSFSYPLLIFSLGIFLIINYGVKYRVISQHIRYKRRLDFADSFDIDLDDVASYPASLYQEYLEQVKIDNYKQRKEEKIEKVQDEFNTFLTKRAADVKEKRIKRGLKVKKRVSSSPLLSSEFKDLVPDFTEAQASA
mmetsp:Transcript_9311/g.15698  ORF Transcript_9311/g.15698 Transcript_9311/m.15698 type:complete len:138 (+) Transcript_9311:273-686(+)